MIFFFLPDVERGSWFGSSWAGRLDGRSSSRGTFDGDFAAVVEEVEELGDW